MSDYIKTEKVLDLLAGVVAEIIKMPPEESEKPARDLIDKRTIDFILGRTDTHEKRTGTHACVSKRTEKHADLISRKAAIEAVCSVCGDTECNIFNPDNKAKLYCPEPYAIMKLPSAEPERVWHPVEKPPAHHKDVIVRGVEAIGNVTVHKVMQWDVDTWRLTNYAPSITWTEWSEI